MERAIELYPYTRQCSLLSFANKDGLTSKRKKFLPITKRIPSIAERILGQPFLGTWLFLLYSWFGNRKIN